MPIKHSGLEAAGYISTAVTSLGNCPGIRKVIKTYSYANVTCSRYMSWEGGRTQRRESASRDNLKRRDSRREQGICTVCRSTGTELVGRGGRTYLIFKSGPARSTTGLARIKTMFSTPPPAIRPRGRTMLLERRPLRLIQGRGNL